MPVTGPIALIVFKNSLKGEYRRARGIIIGASIAEGIYCALATFSYSQIIASYPHLAYYIRYAGAIFLIILGIIFLMQKIHVEEDLETSNDRKRAGLASGFIIAIFNPALFLTWGSATSTIFAWFKTITLWDMILFPIAAAVGIVVWFTLFIEILRKYREKIGEKVGLIAIRGAALLMLGSGIFLLTQAAR